MNTKKFYLKKVFVCLIVVFVIFIHSISAQPGDSRDYSTRNGQELYFYWIHYTVNNQEIPFELNLHLGIDFDYMQQRYRSCNHNHGRYRENVIQDPYGGVVQVIAQALIQKARDAGISPVDLALSFTQSLEYAYNMGDYQRQSSEVIADRTGDCSDKAVLFAGLLYYMNIDCVFLDYPSHLMTAVWCNSSYLPTNSNTRYFLYNGKRYYMCEQTGGNYHIGDCRDEYCKIPAKIIDFY